MKGKIYRFKDYLLDVSEQRLQKNGEDVSLPPRVFETLAVLVERPGQLVSYDELMRAVWKDTFVEDSNLRYCIHTLRKTLEGDCIETIPKRGYRFCCPVESFTAEEFIRKFAGENESAAPRNKNFHAHVNSRAGFLSKRAVFLGIIFLMTAIGVSAFYFWKRKNHLPETPLKTIAVLPFSVISETGDNQAELQKGLADALVFNLSRIKDLKVIPITEIQNYFGKDFDPLQAGKRLKADEVLTGTFRIEKNTARVNASLLRVSDGKAIWTRSFAVKEENKIESENAAALPIARQIELDIARLKDELKIKDLKISEESKNNYLAAREILRLDDFERRQEAVTLFEKVIAENPDWTLANAQYAEVLVLTHGGCDGCPKASEIARRAIESDDSISEAFLVLGFCRQFNFEWETAEQDFRQAINLDPENARTYHEYALMLGIQRRFSEAETNLKKALELEPFSPSFRASFCKHYYFDKKFDEALAQCAQTQKIDFKYWQTTKLLHWIYAAQGRYDEILRLNYGHLNETEKVLNPFAAALIEGNIKKYWEVSLQTRLENSKRRYSPFALAGFYARLGDIEKTLQYLEEATEKPEYDPAAANSDPIFDFIRNDERFIALMKKINL